MHTHEATQSNEAAHAVDETGSTGRRDREARRKASTTRWNLARKRQALQEAQRFGLVVSSYR